MRYPAVMGCAIDAFGVNSNAAKFTPECMQQIEDVTDMPVDVGFDHIESIGLQILNPDFEEPTAWQLRSDGDVRARHDITRKS